MPTAPRGSIGLVTMRWLSSRSDTTCAAFANAASAACASPHRQSMQTLPGTSSAITGAPACKRVGRSGDRGQRPRSRRPRVRPHPAPAPASRRRSARPARRHAAPSRSASSGCGANAKAFAGLRVGFGGRTHRAAGRRRAHPRRSAPQARRALPAPPPCRLRAISACACGERSTTACARSSKRRSSR